VTLLTGFLELQRQTLEWKCAGLTPAQLATPTVATTDLTLLGLVRHLAAVETGWLVGFGGLPVDLWPDVVRDDDEHFRVDPATVTQADVDAAWATWRAARGRARGGAPAAPRRGGHAVRPGRRLQPAVDPAPPRRGVRPPRGHADLLRQATDGATGE
jgi:hypothetical protein